MKALGVALIPTRLRVTDDHGFEKVVLIDRDVFPIGRQALGGLEIPPDDSESIQPRHALIIRDGEEYILKDESGCRGTRVNGRPIRRTILKHGDQITLGASPLRICFLVEGTRAADAQRNRTGRMLEVLRHLHEQLDLKEVPARAVAGILDVFGASWVMISLKGTEGRVEVVASGDAEGRLPSSPSATTGRVIGSSRSHFHPHHLCVPIPGGGQAQGAIEVGPREAGAYAAWDLQLLEAMAAHVGVALANSLRRSEQQVQSAAAGG
jgi:hypothetical protein